MRLAGFLVAGLTFAQTPPKPALEFLGKPLQIESQCKPEDIRAAGLTCSPEEPCPVFLELTSVEPLGTKLFLAGNLHTATHTLESILLVSGDAGKTWIEPVSRLAGAGLENIQFLDYENGWISGHLLQSAPRDAFFLITSDGGKTWRRRPVFGESRVGAIEQFRFDSKSSGAMIIDRIQPGENGMRHELYESLTGGESWMLRQVDSKPLTLKNYKTSPDTGWRLRPDAATKSYRVEKRAGERWQTISSFLVAATDCKPASAAEAEIQPPTEDSVPPESPAVKSGDPVKPAAKRPTLRKH
ncbi:MAG TPA: hypothetical protein VMZ52_01600 [Bryobacteraceae bacterium]|nr:hypothetical protein [Bryobacteraceae bacterium]